MSWYERIKLYYEQGLWDKQKVRNVVGKVLTKQEYERIVGESYEEGVT